MKDAPALEPAEIASIRRAVEAGAAARRPPAATRAWASLVIGAAAIVLVAILLRSERPDASRPPSSLSTVAPTSETRMLIETPGGTRILWIVSVPQGRSPS